MPLGFPTSERVRIFIRQVVDFIFKYTGVSFFRHFETRRYLWYLILCLTDVTRDVGDTKTTHNLTLKRTFRVFFFIFVLPYLCMHTVGLVRMEVVWVCFDVLFFISEFHFLFLLIYILFWLACIYLCCWCFPLGVYFNVCLFAYLFRLYSLFVFIYCSCYVTVLYHFFFESILSYSVCLLTDCIRCILENFS